MIDPPLPAQADALLTAALDKARSGERATAAAPATRALSLATPDVTALHRAGVVYKICQQFDPARECLERALQIDPTFHFSAIELGAIAEETGDKDAARRWFDQAIAAAPQALTAYMMAARLERRRGQGWPALAILNRALAIAPGNLEILGELAEIETMHGNFPGAIAHMEAAFAAGLDVPAIHLRYLHQLTALGLFPRLLAHRATLTLRPGSSEAIQADVFAGQAKLAMAYDRSALLSSAAAREASPRFAQAPAVRDALAAAIRDRQPFSLIRLGDGEGRFLAFLDPALAALMRPEERQAIGQSIWFNWFAADLADITDTQLDALRQALTASLAEANVIGLPLANRLAVDHFHLGYLAYLDRFVGQVLDQHPVIRVTDAFINIALHQLSPFCADLLTGLDFIGVISPHAGLAGRLAAHLGIPTHASHLIPGEMRLPDRPDLSRGHGHFPERYEALLSELTLPHPGAVVLVAAGLLGKIYCARVKALGGIAIDIGSAVDAWMGFATRPGQYQPASAWQLPAA